MTKVTTSPAPTSFPSPRPGSDAPAAISSIVRFLRRKRMWDGSPHLSKCNSSPPTGLMPNLLPSQAAGGLVRCIEP